jgi:DNA-binding response OmpR family regulator
MYNLRKVIDKPFGAAYLQTLPGIGYRFCEPDAAH